jgi:putative GTP pyrophosphokinase
VDIGPEFNDAYEARCETLADLGPVVEHLVQELLRADDIRVHSVRHRVKTKESVQRKVGRKDASYEHLEEIHDLLGLRVITFFPDEVDQVAGVIEAEFSIDHENSVDKRALLDPDRFGYLSRHYVATLDKDREQLTEHVRFEGCCFEIQIRSILQHAWAEIEHDLGYHNAGAIPDSFRRRFSRLAGLLEIADDEFQTLRNEIAEYQSVVDKDVDRAPESVPIDQDSITALVKGNDALVALDGYIVHTLGSELVEGVPQAGVNSARLRREGFETIAQVADSIQERDKVIRAFVDQWAQRPGRQPRPSIYQGISLFYLMYVLVAESKNLSRVEAYLDAESIRPSLGGSRQDLARDVLKVYLAADRSIRKR